MRTQKALKNTISGILYQICSIICAFILPKLILGKFGSDYNGLISSITQFLSWVSVLCAGIGGVTRAALYKPLNEKNTDEISGIINATDLFMKKIALIFLILLVIFSFGYPFLVIKNFDWFFTFSLILVLGINTFAEYYFGITYQNLLIADQKQYIYTLVRIITTILSTFISAALIVLNFDIRIVKLIGSLIFVFNPVFLNIYVKKKYCINSQIKPNNSAIKQRWNAFVQEIAVMVNNNTDIIVLTLFTNVKEVSVYTVYNMIINGVKQLLQTFTTGIGSAFGSMIAEGMSNDRLNEKFSVFEFALYNIATILFYVTLTCIFSFVKLYTSGISDANYQRFWFGVIITLAALFNCYRIPYQTVVYAAGHFKQTRNGSIIEVILNIVISIVLVIKIGLTGVAIGTLVASIFRTCQYATYLSKNIIKRNPLLFLKNIFLYLLVMFISWLIFKHLYVWNINTYFNWIISAIFSFLLIGIIIMINNFLFFRKELNIFSRMIFNTLRRR